jgi:hypothetical protein
MDGPVAIVSGPPPVVNRGASVSLDATGTEFSEVLGSDRVLAKTPRSRLHYQNEHNWLVLKCLPADALGEERKRLLKK